MLSTAKAPLEEAIKTALLDSSVAKSFENATRATFPSEAKKEGTDNDVAEGFGKVISEQLAKSNFPKILANAIYDFVMQIGITLSPTGLIGYAGTSISGITPPSSFTIS